MGQERESGIHFPKGSSLNSPGRVKLLLQSCGRSSRGSCEGRRPGVGAGSHAHLVLKLSVLLHPAVTSMLGLARGSPGQCSHPVPLLLSSPPLPFLIDHSMQRPHPNPASFLSLPPPWLCLGLCVCVGFEHLRNSQLVIRDAMPFLHISSGRLNLTLTSKEICCNP